MKTKIYSLFTILAVSLSTWSQGIAVNETGDAPDASAILDVQSTDKGFLPPRLTLSQRNAISSPATGLIIYNTDESVIQTNQGTPSAPVWKSLMVANNSNIGDIKTGLQSSDHNGWVILDGRSKSSLTATQQIQATALGIGANLPNASNTYLSQNGAALGSVTGSNTRVISQANLPNVDLTAASAGAHTHEIILGYSEHEPFIMPPPPPRLSAPATWPNGINATSQFSTSFTPFPFFPGYQAFMENEVDGAHTHTVPLGGSNAALNIQPRTLSVNTFIFLGESEASHYIAELGSLDCSSATHINTLTEDQASSGVNSEIAYTGGNGGAYSEQTVTSTGVSGLTATLPAGFLANGSGTLTYTITGTPISGGTATFAINIGSVNCALTRTVTPIGAINALNCSGATHNDTLTVNQAASGVNSEIAYTGGNGGVHPGQTVTSTGVSGLTATLSAGSFENGAGTLTYTITGTPESIGTASFVINIGGQTCTLSRTVSPVTVPNSCNPSNPTAIMDVTNGLTGKTWMDRNLGANRAAISSTDAESYGSLYQWGRGSDGHQCVNRYGGDGVTTSSNTALNATVSTDTPPHGDFILTNSVNENWRSPNNNNLWQGVNGTNNPCPDGYRLPTDTELNNERDSWDGVIDGLFQSATNNAAGAFASPLKLSMAGSRDYSDGSFISVGSSGQYWSSSVSSSNSSYMSISNSFAFISTAGRGNGLSVRCIKN